MSYNGGVWEIEATDAFQAWYDENVPRADDLYDRYLAELQEEGLL